MRAAITILVVATILAVLAIEGAAYVALHRQDFAWTRLDLDDPVGKATGAKLAALSGEPRQCRQLLADIGDADRPAPPLSAGQNCGYLDGMRLLPENARSIRFAPAGLVTSCPVAAALALWERDIVQPAAARHFGQRVAAIAHAGSYSCRRLYGRTEGEYSEHASANAVDVLGFTLADGRTINVLRDCREKARTRPSCATSATAPAGSTRPCSRPTTTPPTPTISTSTWRSAGCAAGACAARILVPAVRQGCRRLEHAVDRFLMSHGHGRQPASVVPVHVEQRGEIHAWRGFHRHLDGVALAGRHAVHIFGQQERDHMLMGVQCLRNDILFV